RVVRWVTGTPHLGDTLATPAVIVTIVGALCLVVGGFATRRGPVRDFRLKPGATASMPAAFGADFRLTHMGISRFQSTDHVTAAATLALDRGDRPAGLITSERR